MAERTSVSIGFNTKEAQQEIKSLTNAMKQTQNEFKITDATLKSTGSTLDILNNKYKSLSLQVKQQSEITAKCEQGVKKYSQAQENARQRLEKANAAYEKGKVELRGNKEELEKLKNEVQKAQKAVATADNQYERWNNKLSQSRLAEANLRNELNQTSEALKKQSGYIAQVQDKYKQLSERTSGVQNGLTATGKTLTATVTAPIIAAGTAASKAYIRLNEKLANIGTLSVNDQRLKELKKGIQNVAADTAKSTDDISDGVYQVISAFGDTNDTLKITEINAKAARAGLATTTDSINLTSAVTKGYGDITAKAVEHVADLAFKTVELGQTTFPELAASMGKVIPQSQALGVSQEELFAIFATLTGVTGKAAEVSTQLGAVYTGLMTPSTELQKLLKNLGYESGFAMVKSLGFSGALDTLARATGGSEEKLTQLFSSKEAITAMLALTGAQADTFSSKLEKMGNTAGTTEKAFKTQSEGVNKAGFKFEQSMVRMQIAAQNFGEAASPYIDKAADAVNGLADWLNELDDEDCDRLVKIGISLAVIGPALSAASKGITVVNGGIAIISKLGALFGGTATAATAAGTAAAEAGAAVAGAAATAGAAVTEASATVAGGAATAGAAVTEAGAAATTATAAVSGWTAGLDAAAGASASLLGPLAILVGSFAAMPAIVAIGGKAVDNYYKKLASSGTEALQRADEYNEKSKQAYDLSAEAETVREYYNRYSELMRLKDTDFETAESEKERKDIEQWFIDHYGEYISAEEQKNGVHKATLDFIRNITQAQKDRAEAEKAAARTEIHDDSGEKRENAQKSKQEIIKIQVNIDSMRSNISEADTLSQKISALNEKYKAINNTMSGAERNNAVNQLVKDNQEIFDSYAKLTGGQLTLPELEGGIKNLSGLTENWNKLISENEREIENQEKSIKAYKSALDGLGNTITSDVLNSAGFTSITDLFSSGDSAKIQKAFNDVVVQCKLLGMTSQETSLQVGLFKNGFSNLSDAMAEGDKAMDAVVTDMNDYMHTVAGLPENIQFSINANGDITVIDTAKDGIEKIDGASATATVKIDGGDSEAKVMTLQELIDNFGASKAVALLQADDKATVTIDGVSYRLKNYDNETGIATLQADGSEAAITINTTTHEVYAFDNVKGTATLKINDTQATEALNNAINKAKNGWATTFTARLKAKIETGSAFGGFFAKGTDNAPEGPAVINDENGVADPREIVKHKGSYYLFEGRNVLVNLSKGDSVYTAAQTKKMLASLPHYATGKNNKSFDKAKENFEYRQKTSVVTDEEALLWWQNILKKYARDADVVKEANIEIYELTNKINDAAVKNYKNKIKKQESASKEWIDYEVKMHNLSIDEQIAAYGRMDTNYRNTLSEMTENTKMSAEELEEVWGEYYATIRDHEIKTSELRKKKLDDLNKQSLSYVDERTYYNDWKAYNDTPEEAFERIKKRNSEYLAAGDITYDEYVANVTKAGQEFYEGRLKNSEKWLETQKKLGAISEEEYRAGLKRVKDYTEDYYKKGIISGQYYNEAMDNANSDLFDNMSASLEAYLNEYYKAQDKMLSARRAEIEKEYEDLENAEKKSDRAAELKDLQSQYAKYQNAVTIEGKKKLKETKDNIDKLKKEEEKEKRESEKKSRLDEVDNERERLAEEQENSLKGISKYTAQALGIISGGNNEMAAKFNSIVESYNSQQAQLAQTGYDTISKIVDMTNLKLSGFNQNIVPAPSTPGNNVTVEVKQTFNNKISDKTAAAAYGKRAGSSVRDLDWRELVIV